MAEPLSFDQFMQQRVPAEPAAPAQPITPPEPPEQEYGMFRGQAVPINSVAPPGLMESLPMPPQQPAQPGGVLGFSQGQVIPIEERDMSDVLSNAKDVMQSSAQTAEKANVFQPSQMGALQPWLNQLDAEYKKHAQLEFPQTTDFYGDLGKIQEQHKKDAESIRNELMPQLQEARDKIANGKIEPGRYWHNQGVFGSLMAMLGAAMGSYAEAISGGKISNTALVIIDKAIERDIDAQKTDLERAVKLHQVVGQDIDRINAQQSHDFNMFINSEKAKYDMYQWKLNSVNGWLENQLKGPGSPVFKENIKQTMLGTQKLQKEVEYRQSEIDLNNMKARQVGQGKPLASTDSEKINDLNKALAGLKELKQEAKSSYIGPIERIPGVGTAIRLIEPSEQTAFRTKVGLIVNTYTRAMYGARASDRERAISAQLLPNMSDRSINVFISKTNAALESLERDKYQTIKTLKAAGKDIGRFDHPEVSVETKQMGGKTYKKAPGGWQEVE